MKILDLRALRGPNLWSRYQTIYMRLDLQDFANRPTNTHSAFTDSMMELLPSIWSHRCGVGTEGGFVGRMRDGTYLGHVLEHVAIELQCLAGMEVGFGKTRETSSPGVYHVVYRYRDERVGLEAGRQALQLVEALTRAERVNLEEMVQRLRELREESMLGPSTRSIVEEAVSRDIPFLRLNDASLVQLGWGAPQRRIQATMSGQTSALGVEIADDKFLTKTILSRGGIPTPEGDIVDSLEELESAADQIGFPVTVKPLVGNHGRGISVRVSDAERLKAAFESAKRIHDQLIVERHLEGQDFRILVINHKMVAASLRTPANVVGDGKHTIQELIDEENKNPLRGFGHEKVLTYIDTNLMTLRLLDENGLSLESIPETGHQIRLKSTANLSTGGTAQDVTDSVHSENRFMAERISRYVDLDIMGIDVIASTLETPIDDIGGGIVEVSAAPGFRMHLAPTIGKPRAVAVPVLDMLFGSDGKGRIPLVAVTGTNGKTTTVRLISHLLKTIGRRVGSASTDGINIENHKVLSGDYSGPAGAAVVLQDSVVDAAVLEVARGGILRRGLGYDVADVAVVLNVAEDHFGLEDIFELDQLAEVKGVVAEAVHPVHGRVVLNADDPRVLAMKENVKAPVILFSLNPESEAVRTHLAAGGTVFTIENAVIVLREGEAPPTPIVSVFEVPITLGGKALYNISNSLAAAAAAYAVLGLKIGDLKSGLSTFNPSIGQSPGRLNLIEVDGVDFLVDYAHNVPAILALKQVVAALCENRPDGHRRIGVTSGTGNRLEKDITSLGAAVAGTYTDLIIKDSDRRNRPPGEVAKIFQNGAIAAGFPEDRIEMILDEQAAVAAAIAMARPGDLVVIHPDDIQGSIQTLLDHKESRVNLDLT